jgi:hypothetical protein
MEGWAYRKPVFFLPPASGTQYLQMAEYRRRGVAACGLHLADLFPPLLCSPADGRSFVRAIFAQLAALAGDVTAQQVIADRLAEWFADPATWPRLVTAGTRYLDSLGGNGLDDCVRLILDLVRERDA